MIIAAITTNTPNETADLIAETNDTEIKPKSFLADLVNAFWKVTEDMEDTDFSSYKGWY